MGERFYDVVLSRGPGPGGDFVELENERGEGCSAGPGGGWVDRGDEYAVLRIPVGLPEDRARIKELETALRAVLPVSDEWDACPLCCGALEEDGHLDECPVPAVARALAGEETKDA